MIGLPKQTHLRLNFIFHSIIKPCPLLLVILLHFPFSMLSKLNTVLRHSTHRSKWKIVRTDRCTCVSWKSHKLLWESCWIDGVNTQNIAPVSKSLGSAVNNNCQMILIIFYPSIMPNFNRIFDLTPNGKFLENPAWKRTRIRKTRQLNDTCICTPHGQATWLK